MKFIKLIIRTLQYWPDVSILKGNETWKGSCFVQKARWVHSHEYMSNMTQSFPWITPSSSVSTLSKLPLFFTSKCQLYHKNNEKTNKQTLRNVTNVIEFDLASHIRAYTRVQASYVYIYVPLWMDCACYSRCKSIVDIVPSWYYSQVAGNDGMNFSRESIQLSAPLNVPYWGIHLNEYINVTPYDARILSLPPVYISCSS